MRRSDPVRAAIERFCERFSTADVEGFDASIADDAEAFVIGTQRWTGGREEWLGNFKFLVDNGLVVPDGSGVRVEATDVRAYAATRAGRSAHVAWSGGHGTHAPARQGSELVGREGPREEVSLCEVAAELGEAGPLLPRLHALGDDLEAESVRQLHRAAQDRSVGRVVRDAGDEGAVDLDLVDRQLAQVGE